MRTKHLSMLCVTAVVLGVLGCTTLPRAASNIVGIDVRHGQAWPGLVETLASNGFKAITIDVDLDASTLSTLGALIIAGPTKAYEPAEVNAVERYVAAGGGLVCAGQAWSWTYKEYGGKPIDSYPLNELGRSLGFQVTEHNIAAPVHFATEIMAGIGSVERTDWWPSEVVVFEKGGKPIMKDENRRTIGALQPYARGRVVVYGHDGVLKDNPKVLIQSVSYAVGLP